MPVGKSLDAHDTFRMALAAHYKAERDRTEGCLADIISILGYSDLEHEQVEKILERLAAHYARADRS